MRGRGADNRGNGGPGRSSSTGAMVVAIALLISSVVAWGTMLARPRAAEPSDSGSFAASPVAGPAPVAATGAGDRVGEAIDALIAGEQGVYGIVLMRPDGTLLYNRNGDTPFVSASLYKLILLADICAAIDAGALSLDTPLYVAPEYFWEYDGLDSYFDISYAGYETTVGEALYAAGAYSSNVAAMALLSLSTPQRLNETATALGLRGTFLFTDPTTIPSWPPDPDEDTTPADASSAQNLVLSYATDGQVNLTTPMDMANFFVMLLDGRVFNERVSAMIYDILHQQMVDDRFPALLPPGTQFAHKTGNLDRVVHDVGVIYAPHGPIILAAMVEAPASDERATQVVQRLALIAYGVYEIPPLTAPDIAMDATPVALDGTAINAAGADRSAATDSDAVALESDG